MTKEQEAFFAMTLKVKNFNVKNAADMTAVPAVTPYYDRMDDLIQELIDADTGSRADLTGYAVAKANKRFALEQLSQKVSNAVSTYAVVNDDMVLLKRADFPKSDWYRCTEEELVTQATIVHNLAKPIELTIAPFGATQADVTTLLTAITDFTTVISDPTLAIDQRKQDNETLLLVLDRLRTLFNTKLDVIMRSFEINDVALYNKYKSARAIDINGSATPPTYQVQIEPSTLKLIHTEPVYDANTFYTVQNLGSEAVQFSLSDNAATEGAETVILLAGERRSRLAQNLSLSGKYLVVKNDNVIPIDVKVWVE